MARARYSTFFVVMPTTEIRPSFVKYTEKSLVNRWTYNIKQQNYYNFVGWNQMF